MMLWKSEIKVLKLYSFQELLQKVWFVITFNYTSALFNALDF